MATCGYICPKCEGRGYDEDGNVCDWCGETVDLRDNKRELVVDKLEYDIPEDSLIGGAYYHIYNRGNNRENLFYMEENYLYFLRKYKYYLSDFVDTISYCLLPNHFHLFVRIKTEEEIRLLRPEKFEVQSEVGKIRPVRSARPVRSDLLVSLQFSHFFNSYAKSINKQEGRVGSLFQKRFRRKLVNNENYFRNLIAYIHINPQMHGISNNYRTYNHSSYKGMMEGDNYLSDENCLIQYFGTQEDYIYFHQNKITNKLDSNEDQWSIED